MSNTDAALALIRAINHDDFDAILAAHRSDVQFYSFRGPNLRDSVSVREWYRDFLERYADCTYTEPEVIEEGNVVAVRAVITAKGYDWREFEQNVVDVMEFDDQGLVVSRRLYAQQRDVVLDKGPAAALKAATGADGGSQSATRKAVDDFYAALLGGDNDGARALIHDKSAYIDSVYGIGAGADAILDIVSQIPQPLFGSWRITASAAGKDSAIVEMAIDASRPRAADFVRVLDGKVSVIEGYWMLREIGVNPFEEYSNDRHMRRVSQPI